jgi:predicted GIY-YIG superfamily endonuclease
MKIQNEEFQRVIKSKAIRKLDEEEAVREERISRFGEVTENSDNFILYRHFNSESVLIYIGITNDPPKRLRMHKAKSAWWAEVMDGGYTTYEMFDSREELILAEKEAIASEQPRDNTLRP